MSSSTFENRNARAYNVATRAARELTYSSIAASYDDNPNPMLSLEQRVLRPLLPALNGKHAVDLGCGTGRWLQEVTAVTKNVTGVDSSAAMLRMAEQKLGGT